MPNNNPEKPFEATKKDITNLKQTASDAATDLGASASATAGKVADKARDAASELTKESAQKLAQVHATLKDVVDSANQYVASRPFACIGTALAAGYLLGKLWSRSSSSDDAS